MDLKLKEKLVKIINGSDFNDLTDLQIKKIIALSNKNTQYNSIIESILLCLNDLFKLYGTECVYTDFIYSYYWQHTAFSYINTSDTYIKTFCFNVHTRKFKYLDLEQMINYSENKNNY